jgi:hypothetical protein
VGGGDGGVVRADADADIWHWLAGGLPARVILCLGDVEVVRALKSAVLRATVVQGALGCGRAELWDV